MSEPVALKEGYAWTPAPRLGGVVTAEQAAFWDENGYLLVKGALAASAIAAVRDEIDDLVEAHKARLREAGSTRMFEINDPEAITFTTHLVLKSEGARAFAANPAFAKLALDLVGPEVRLYWDQAVYKMPEPDREFPWHQDNGYTYVEPQHYLTCWTPLTEATVENGCPWIAPGLHRMGTLKHRWTDLGWRCLENDAPAVAVEAEVGDIVCFSSLTPHRTGPNRTDAVRKAYILQYAPDGAVMYPRQGDPVAAHDPERNFMVASGGRPV